VRCCRRIMSLSSRDSAGARAGPVDNVSEARAGASSVSLVLLFDKGSTSVALVA
jgi:hypothetical protein